MLIVYVDDIILTGNDNLELERLKKALIREFEIKDLGPRDTFLVWSLLDLRKVFSFLKENIYLTY